MTDSNKTNNNETVSQLMDGEWQALDAAECVARICADEASQEKWSRYHLIRDVIKNEHVLTDQNLASRISAAIDDEPSYSNITPFTAKTVTASSEVQDLDIVSDDETALPGQLPQATAQRVSQQAAGSSSWVNTAVAGFALAASVALVTVVGLNVFEQPQGDNVQTVASVEGVVQPAAQIQDGGVQSLALVNNATATSNMSALQNEATVLPEVEFVANTGPFWVSSDSAGRVSGEKRLNMMLSQHIENSPTAGLKGLLPYSRLVGYENTSE